jgi:hypothetical protein
MKRTPRTLLMAAAVSGLVSGAAIQQGRGDPTNAVAPGKVAPLKKIPKVHDCAGQNDCKALGGCKTEAHSCKFKNACKGKGGCELTAKDIKAWEKKQKEEADKAAAKTPIKEPAKDTPKPVAPVTP